MEHLIRTLTARLLASRSLPRTDPLPWDELMRDPAYCQALERLPSGG